MNNCPECNKPYKHIIAHLKNKHGWDVEDIFNYKPNDNIGGEEDAARKVSEAELEVESSVRRSVDKTVMMHALTDLNITIRDVYERLESSMKNIVVEKSIDVLVATRLMARETMRRVAYGRFFSPRANI